MRFGLAIFFRASALVAAALLLAGCSVTPDKGPAKASGGGGKETHGHTHPGEGPHGGALAEWGEEEFHAEFTVDHAKKEATVYILDGDAKAAPKLEAKDITNVTLTIKATPPITIELKPDATKSDPKGIAFSGINDLLGKEQEFEGAINGKVKDKPFAGDFAEKAHDHKHEKK